MRTIWTPELSNQSGPKYQQIFSAIKAAVQAGDLTVNTKLPPIREIAFHLGMTPSTVVRAYQLGIEAGFLEARVGDGTYVKTQGPSWQKFDSVSHALFDDPRTKGYNLRSSAIPRVGQDQLAQRLLLELASAGELAVTRYTSNSDYAKLQNAAAIFLNREGITCEAVNIVLTRGATNATSIAARVISHGGRLTKAMTEPECYVGFRDVEFLGAVEIISIEVDEFGVTPASIRENCVRHQPSFLMTSSIIQNPYSLSMSDERMAEIAALAREFDFEIVDDILHKHLLDTPRKTLRDFAPERVWTVTSLSKMGYPALQFGMMLPPVDRVREVEARIGAYNIRPSEIQRPLVEAILSDPDFLTLQVQTQLEIKERQKLVREMMIGVPIQMTQGSPYFWMKLPAHWPVSRLLSELSAHNIAIASGDTFAPHNAAPNAVRVTLGGPLSQNDFTHALKVMRDILVRDEVERLV